RECAKRIRWRRPCQKRKAEKSACSPLMSEVEVCRMTTARHPLRVTNVVLALLCVTYFINYVVRVSVNTAALVFQNELHLSNTQVGLIFSPFAFPYLALQFIGGWVSDRWGARQALTLLAITPEELGELRQHHAAGKKRPPVPYARLARRMLTVTVVYFCYGWTLWFFLTWIPSYFLHSYHLRLRDSALFSSGVFLGGVVGD